MTNLKTQATEVELFAQLVKRLSAIMEERGSGALVVVIPREVQKVHYLRTLQPCCGGAVIPWHTEWDPFLFMQMGTINLFLGIQLFYNFFLFHNFVL